MMSGSSNGTSSMPSMGSSSRLLMSTSLEARAGAGAGASAGADAGAGARAGREGPAPPGVRGTQSSAPSRSMENGSGGTCGSLNMASRSASVHCMSSVANTREGLEWETRRTLASPLGSCYVFIRLWLRLATRSRAFAISGASFLSSASIFSSITMNGT